MKNLANIDEILNEYGLLLSQVDTWFAGCMDMFPASISCKPGCYACCRGLFDITMLDAYYLKKGFDLLPLETKAKVMVKVRAQLISLKKLWPELEMPFTLNHRPDDEWEMLMPEEDETPCVLLADDGRCLLYESRPMTCRLHGIPLIDYSGEPFHDDWCTENFKEDGCLSMEGLRWGFYDHFDRELGIFRRFAEQMTGKGVNEMDTLIPLALLIDFDGFDWKGWLS